MRKKERKKKEKKKKKKEKNLNTKEERQKEEKKKMQTKLCVQLALLHMFQMESLYHQSRFRELTDCTLSFLCKRCDAIGRFRRG